MSVVAWDGKTIAADRQATCSGMIRAVSKIERLPSGVVVAWTGDQEQGLVLARWFASFRYNPNAAPPWPAFQAKDHWTRLVVAEYLKLPEMQEGVTVLSQYEQEPIAQEIIEPFFAFGAGRDFAMGALAMGADAKTAVEIACRYSDSCGLGIDSFTLGAE